MALNNISPIVTQLYEIPLPTKRRAAAIVQGQAATITFQFLDGTGNPVNLTAYDPITVNVNIREVIKTQVTDIFSVPCTIIDEPTGMVSFAVPSGVFSNPGTYLAEFGVFDINSNLLFTNKVYLWVDRGLFGVPNCPNAGPPTIDEIRLFIRDNAPEENFMLDDFEFDLAEICQAAELGVRYWNTAQPPIGIFFNTTNYAVRDRWLGFIAGQMFMVAAHRFRRNQLQYQAGGMTVDDQNKYQQYQQVGMAMIQDYKEWVKQKKVQLNCEMAITSYGSAYGATAYQLLNTGI